ncbi:MAG TPA: STAS/SEC14 domain-containing protein [Gammaproteobacteria bacterium]|nr:STAS/SEC14 domain-containing protein [Gammaproteobacteria bacterium]
MLIINLDKENLIAMIEPTGALDVKDFQAAASTIDPYIEKVGKLNGLIIHTESFPGWDSFEAFISHLKFVKDHHCKIRRVALVTDSTFLTLAETLIETLGGHFIDAEIRHFSYQELEQSRRWIIEA